MSFERSPRPCISSLPEVPLFLIFDSLSIAPGVYSPRGSSDAIALSKVNRALNTLYRESYVKTLTLVDENATPPLFVDLPFAAQVVLPSFARMLARFPAVVSVDLTHSTFVKADLRSSLVGNGSPEALARAQRITAVRLSRPVSRAELSALVDCCPGLRSIELHGFGALDSTPIARLVELRSLRFVHCCLSAGLGPNSLRPLSKLTELVMRYCRIRSGGLISMFESLAPSVTHLDVRWCHSLSPTAMAVLPPLLSELKVDAFRPWRGVNCLPPSFCEAKEDLNLTVQGKSGVGASLFDSGKVAETWLAPIAQRLIYLDVFEFDFECEGEEGRVEDRTAMECMRRMRKLKRLRVGHVGHQMAAVIASLPSLEVFEVNEATFTPEAVLALGSGTLDKTLKVCDFRKAMYVPRPSVDFLRLSLPECDVRTR